MRVLLIDVNCKSGSTGKIVYDLYSYLNRNGDAAAVCYGRGTLVNEPNIIKFGIDLETELHAFLTRITGYTGCFSYFSTLRLISFISQFKPDVVHIHELHAYFVNIRPLLEYLKRKNVGVVLTLHCEFNYTGKCGHSNECTQWQTECRKCPNIFGYVRTLWFDRTGYMFRQKKKAFSGFDRLIVTTPSLWLTDRAKQSFLAEYPITTVYNGINTDIFQPKNTDGIRRKYGIPDDKKVVLALAPNLMSTGKGGRFVLELSQHRCCRDMFFILVGVDNIDTITKIKYENVVVEGRTKDQELLALYYSIADVFVLCSSRETFSLTCAEAMCCGTPVVGFKCGAAEATFTGEYAHFVEYGNVDSLAASVKSVPKKTDISAIKVRSSVLSEFGSAVMCEKYKSIYNSLMGEYR